MTSAPLAQRRAELMRCLGSAGVAIVPAAREVTRANDTHYRFRQSADFAYLTGFPEPEAIAVLCPGRKVKTEGGHERLAEFVLFVRPRDKHHEIWEGRRAGPEGAIAQYGADEAFNLAELDTLLPSLVSGREAVHYNLGEWPDLDARIIQVLKNVRAVSRRGAVAPHSITALEQTLHEMRLIKDADEIALLRHAAKVSADAHVAAMRATAPGKNEANIANLINAHFMLEGCEPGYNSIVGGGDNACILHYTENNQTLRDGDLLLIDAGAEYRGYTGDITRTFPVNGRFTPAQKRLYDVVLAANIAAIAELTPGNAVGKAHETSTRVLTEGMVALGLLKLCPEYPTVDALIAADQQKQFFMHGTGHWLGMDVHDVGRYRIAGEYRTFAPGMVMTVEPGIYVAPDTPDVPAEYLGLGIRIEDDVVVTMGAPEVLTDGVPKTTDAIEALMQGRA